MERTIVRSIGDHAGMRYSVDGDLLSETEYEKHLSEALPGAGDERFLNDILQGQRLGSSDELDELALPTRKIQ